MYRTVVFESADRDIVSFHYEKAHTCRQLLYFASRKINLDEWTLLGFCQNRDGSDLGFYDEVDLDDSVVDYILSRHPEELPFMNEAKQRVTFYDLWLALVSDKDVYDLLGICDSMDREYAFEGLVEALKKASIECGYNDVYNAWLGHHSDFI